MVLERGLYFLASSVNFGVFEAKKPSLNRGATAHENQAVHFRATRAVRFILTRIVNEVVKDTINKNSGCVNF